MYRSILVPLDGSSFSEGALPLALSIARRAAASLQLLYVHPPWEAAYPEVALEYFESLTSVNAEIKTRQRAYLDALVQRLQQFYPGKVEAAVRDGAIAATIRQHVSERGIDLVVMTTHGRGTVARAWLGSVADDLVRDLPVPVLLVRPGEAAPEFGREVAMKHVLVPLDGSKLAEQIIEPALALGTVMNAEFTLLRVVKPVLPPVTQPPAFFQGMQALVEAAAKIQMDLVNKARADLDGIAARLQARQVNVRVRVTVAEQPASTILEMATTGAVDLVAMETHGRRGLSRLLLGSVADKVLRCSTVPLLVHMPA
jgi:nucleotide-binding universal stress UspA family protein